MTRKCIIKGCRSNEASGDTTPSFKVPQQEDRVKEWSEKIEEATGEALEISQGENVCMKHFEEKFICRYAQAYDVNFKQSSNQKAKLCLTKDAVPTLFDVSFELEDDSTAMESSEPNSEQMNPQKGKKRGSSGLANLQKARMRKMLRRERMQMLIQQRRQQKSEKSSSEGPQKKKARRVKPEMNTTDDYFLGDREETEAEKLIIPLRLTNLIEHLHDGTKLCKSPPASIKDTKAFPTFNIIRQIDGLTNNNNPLKWSPKDIFHFIRYILPTKGTAKVFLAEEIDGEALLNLTRFDLINYLRLDESTSDGLIKVFTKLRQEVINRFVNT